MCTFVSGILLSPHFYDADFVVGLSFVITVWLECAGRLHALPEGSFQEKRGKDRSSYNQTVEYYTAMRMSGHDSNMDELHKLCWSKEASYKRTHTVLFENKQSQLMVWDWEREGAQVVFCFLVWEGLPWVGHFVTVRWALHTWSVHILHACCNAMRKFRQAKELFLLSCQPCHRDAWLRSPVWVGPGLSPSSLTLGKPLSTSGVSRASPTSVAWCSPPRVTGRLNELEGWQDWPRAFPQWQSLDSLPCCLTLGSPPQGRLIPSGLHFLEPATKHLPSSPSPQIDQTEILSLSSKALRKPCLCSRRRHYLPMLPRHYPPRLFAIQTSLNI